MAEPDNQEAFRAQAEPNAPLVVPTPPKAKKPAWRAGKFWAAIFVVLVLAGAATFVYLYSFHGKSRAPLSAPAQSYFTKFNPFPIPKGTVVKTVSNTKTASGMTEVVSSYRLPVSPTPAYNLYLSYFKGSHVFIVTDATAQNDKKIIVATSQADTFTVTLVPNGSNTDVTVDIVAKKPFSQINPSL